jgi:hypothetical protein
MAQLWLGAGKMVGFQAGDQNRSPKRVWSPQAFGMRPSRAARFGGMSARC